jgi:hypothetical protein
MKLADVRATLATILTPDDNEWVIYQDLVDAIDVPCLMLLWDEPWFESVGVCNGFAFPAVTAVSGRIEPGTALATLEGLVSQVITKTRQQPGWGIRTITAPRAFDLGMLSYIAARIGFRVAVTF